MTSPTAPSRASAPRPARARLRAPRAAALAALLALVSACAGPPRCPPNSLTRAERALGWELLFDGETLEGWQSFATPGEPQGWSVIDGTLARTGPGGDLVTEQEFSDFELRLQWRISPGGNSGIFYLVSLDGNAPWETGPEMQVLDNARHPDGRDPLTSAGSNYALYAPSRDATLPVGEWNQVHLIVHDGKVEHWLNGERQCSYTLGSPEWKARVANSKFANLPRYGTLESGRIALQDHGDPVWFRAIKVRELTE